MERLIFRHLTGSKALEVETFPLRDLALLQIGRDPVCDIRFDATRDDLVGRLHARIERAAGEPARFTLVDLDSRNGTFLNRQRITAPAALAPGDVIQFGPGGPQIEFQIDPLPEGLMRTRLAPQAGAIEPTRLAPAAAGPQKPAVGAATVQRMVSDAQKTTRRSAALIAAVAAVAVLAIGAASWKLIFPTPVNPDPDSALRLTPTQIAERYADATVYVEMSWKLMLPETGGQLYQEYLPPQRKGGQPVPVYIRLPDGTVEPSLTLERGNDGINQPLGGQGTGSGFVVANDGFILTNRHVAAPWETAYTNLQPGVVFDLQARTLAPLDTPPARWVPAASRVLGRAEVGKTVEGRLDYLDVTFARNRLRVPAQLVRVSDKHDAALIKVDLPQPVRKVDLFDNYDTIKAGMTVTIMGYPGRSPGIVMSTKSDDPFAPQAQRRVVPDPTVTPTSVGRVLRGSQQTANASDEYFSDFGDSYQLKDDGGAGNSGGPLFDDMGRVIGIYYAGRRDGTLGFAVPIKYGLELMSVTAVVR